MWNVDLEHIEIDAENPYYMAENDAIYTKNKKILVAFVNNVVSKFEIPSGVEEIGSNAFAGRNRLSEVIIPNTVIEIKNNCVSRTNLTKLEIPNSVERIDSFAFSGCANLKEIIIDKTKGSIIGSPWRCTYGERAIKWLR